jgi:hypothetical protein
VKVSKSWGSPDSEISWSKLVASPAPSDKAITRTEAAKFVKGIAPFEEQTWLAETGVSEGAGYLNHGDHRILRFPGVNW